MMPLSSNSTNLQVLVLYFPIQQPMPYVANGQVAPKATDQRSELLEQDLGHYNRPHPRLNGFGIFKLGQCCLPKRVTIAPISYNPILTTLQGYFDKQNPTGSRH